MVDVFTFRAWEHGDWVAAIVLVEAFGGGHAGSPEHALWIHPPHHLVVFVIAWCELQFTFSMDLSIRVSDVLAIVRTSRSPAKLEGS